MTAATVEPLCPGCGRPVSECQADDVDESPAAQDRDWTKLLVWFGPAAFVALCFLIGWLAS